MSRRTGFKVMTKECETCIFHTNTSPIDRERFEQLKAEWQKKGVVQECHQATIKHERIACRGHFNRWLWGNMPYPLDQIKHDLHMDDLSNEQFVDVCKNIGWITFTVPESKS